MNIPVNQLMFYGLDGEMNRYHLPRPLEFELVQSFDSPAHSLEGIFLCRQWLPEFRYVEVWNGNERLFRGITDEQSVTENDTGRRLKLIARSKGALLLDNEAYPGTHQNCDLEDIFDEHIRPYGFAFLDTESCPFFNHYSILKGTSEWEAFFRFYRNSNLGTPYVDQNDHVVCKLHPHTGVTHKISNRNNHALHYSSLKLVNNRYSPITQFFIRDDDGCYSSTYENHDLNLGLTRKRYLIPSSEYAGFENSGWNEAEVRIARSMLGKHVVTVTVPGYQKAAVCDRVNLDWKLKSFPSLFVFSLRWKLSAAGVSTTFTLLDPQYI